jgi:hypothetical protein
MPGPVTLKLEKAELRHGSSSWILIIGFFNKKKHLALAESWDDVECQNHLDGTQSGTNSSPEMHLYAHKA